MATTWITPVSKSFNAVLWRDVDCSADIPSGATGVILHLYNNSTSTKGTGWRNNGSSDARTSALNAYQHLWCAVGVDANRIFEGYRAGVQVEFWVVGYFTDEAYFFVNAPDKSLGGAGVWSDIDISGDTVGSDVAIGAFFDVITGATTQTWGFRNNASTDARFIGGTQHSASVIGVDANEICEGYISSTSVDFFLNGYLKSGSVFNINATDYSLGSTGSYADLTTLPAGATNGAFIEVVDVTSTNTFGLRKDGSSEDIYGRAGLHCWGMVECASGIIEGKISSTEVDFYLTGYVGTGSLSRTVTPVTVALSSSGKTRTITNNNIALKSTLTKTITPTTISLVRQRSIANTIALNYTLTRTVTPVTLALQKVGITKTVTPTTIATRSTLTKTITPATVSLKSTLTKTVSSSIALQSTSTKSVTSSIALQSTKVNSVVNTISLYWLRTKTVANSIAVYSVNTKTITPITASISEVKTRTITPVSVAVQSTITKSVANTIALSSFTTYDRTVTPITISLKSTINRTTASSVALKSTLTRTVSSTIALKTTGTRTLSSSISLQSTAIRSIASTVSLNSLNITRTVVSTVALQSTLTKTISSSIAIKSTLTKSVSSTIAINSIGSLRTVPSTIAITTDIISNNGFEFPGAGDPDIWAVWLESAGDGALADETVLVNSGAHAAKLTGGASNNTWLYQRPKIKVSQYHTLRFWTRGDGSNAGQFGIYDMSHGTWLRTMVTTGVTGVEYTEVVYYFATPAGCTQIELDFRAYGNGSIFYVDDVSIKPYYIRTVASTIALQNVLTKTVVSTIALQKTLTRTTASTVALKSTLTKTITPATIATSSQNTRTIATTLSLTSSGTRTIPSTISTSLISTKTVASTISLKSTLTRTVSSSISLSGSYITRVVTTNIALLRTSARSTAATVALQKTFTKTTSNTVALQKTLTRNVSTTTALQNTLTRTLPNNDAQVDIYTDGTNWVNSWWDHENTGAITYPSDTHGFSGKYLEYITNGAANPRIWGEWQPTATRFDRNGFNYRVQFDYTSSKAFSARVRDLLIPGANWIVANDTDVPIHVDVIFDIRAISGWNYGSPLERMAFWLYSAVSGDYLRIDNLTITPWNWSNSVALSSSGNIRTVYSSIALQRTSTKSTTNTISLQSTLTRTISNSTTLQSTLTRTVASSISLYWLRTRSVTNTVALTSTNTRTVTNTLSLTVVNTKTTTNTIALVYTTTRSIATNIALQRTLTKNVSVNITISETKTRTLSCNLTAIPRYWNTVTTTISLKLYSNFKSRTSISPTKTATSVDSSIHKRTGVSPNKTTTSNRPSTHRRTGIRP